MIKNGEQNLILVAANGAAMIFISEHVRTLVGRQLEA